MHEKRLSRDIKTHTCDTSLTFNTKISPVALLISKLLSAGFSGSIPGPVKKYIILLGRSTSASVAVTYKIIHFREKLIMIIIFVIIYEEAHTHTHKHDCHLYNIKIYFVRPTFILEHKTGRRYKLIQEKPGWKYFYLFSFL